MGHVEVTTRWMVLVMCIVLICTIISTSALFYIQSNQEKLINGPVLKSNSDGKVSIRILSNQDLSSVEPKNAQISIKFNEEPMR
jgi:hypothetical protein